MKLSFCRKESSRESILSILLICTTIGILTLDLVGTASFAVWLLYFFPLLFGIWLFSNKCDGYLLTIVSSGFIILAFYISHDKGPEQEIVLVNRLMFIGVLWITSFLLIGKREAEGQVRAAYTKLSKMTSELVIMEERERKAIASILHDRVAQTLAAIKFRMESLREHLSPSGEGLYAETKELVSESIKETRNIMTELNPPVLSEFGLVAALEWLCNQTEKKHGIPVHFASEAKLKLLPRDIQVLLFESVRELLSNVVKHAKAKRARVSVAGDDDTLQIEVEDDGIGFDWTRVDLNNEFSGFGLFSIRERLKNIGWNFQLTSTVGAGTRVIMKK